MTGRCGWGTTTTIHGGGDKSLKRGDQFNDDEFFVPQSLREGGGNKILDVSVYRWQNKSWKIY